MSKLAIGSLRKEVNIELGKASKKREKYSLLQYPGPVLKINNHATGGWRTKDILGGPKSLETKKLGSSKG